MKASTAGKTRIRQATCWLVLLVAVPSLGAEIEFLDGRTLTCRTLSKSQTHLKVEIDSGGRKVIREFALSTIHRVKINDKTYVLNEKAADDSAADSTDPQRRLRTRSELQELIEREGRTPPDWYQQTPVEYPDSLDLSWPMPAPKPWNNQKNVGQYIWDVLNPNPGKWRSGVRLMHHILQENKNQPETRQRVIRSLGSMYFRFFQDYPRAAFWWEQGQVSKGDEDSLALAECYWRLGNTQLARTMIDRRRVRVGTIKLLADMGELGDALKIADLFARQAPEPQEALLVAGDACRNAGRFEEAVKYYQQVLDRPPMRNESYDERARGRAAESIEAIRLFELTDPSKVADGTYRAESLGYEGPLTMEVKIRQGRIEDVRVSQHTEKQFYSAFTDVPQQIIQKQSVRDIDATSRATITAEAMIRATAKAIANAQ